jgi:hypothetical protein
MFEPILPIPAMPTCIEISLIVPATIGDPIRARKWLTLSRIIG